MAFLGWRGWQARRIGATVFLVVSTVGATPALAQQMARAPMRFVEVSELRGIGAGYAMASGMAGGAAVADYDRDGDADVFLPTGGGDPDLLYRNDGGHFVEVAAQVGLDSTDRNRAALWFDYDGDRRLDLVVANDTSTESSLVLYHQDVGGTFADVTESAGLKYYAGVVHIGSLAAGDVDDDGFLDLYFAVWGTPSRIFHNQRDGTFEDITVSSGMYREDRPLQWQPVFADFNGDGWEDIFVAVDAQPNLLWINQGDLTFVDRAAEAGVDQVMNSMGVAMGDFDDDGDPDLYHTNIFNAVKARYNVFLQNDSVGDTLQFADRSHELGLDYGGWGWGTTFLDADLDTHLDLAATNGFGIEPWTDDRSRFFLRRPTATPSFTDVSRQADFADDYWGSALAAFDYDLDGDLDLLQACQRGPLNLLENRPTTGASHRNHWLVVRPRMPGPNHRAIGAVVRAEVSGRTLSRWVTAGISLMSQEPAVAHFGLGRSPAVDSLRVEFPNGTSVELGSVPADGCITVTPPPLLMCRAVTGSLAGGDALDLLDSDNQYLEVRSPQNRASRSEIALTWQLANPNANSLTVAVETAVDRAPVYLKTWLWNQIEQRYDWIDSSPVGPTDSWVVLPGINSANYVDQRGQVQLLLEHKAAWWSDWRGIRGRFDQVVVTGD